MAFLTSDSVIGSFMLVLWIVFSPVWFALFWWFSAFSSKLDFSKKLNSSSGSASVFSCLLPFIIFQYFLELLRFNFLKLFDILFFKLGMV